MEDLDIEKERKVKIPKLKLGNINKVDKSVVVNWLTQFRVQLKTGVVGDTGQVDNRITAGNDSFQ